jgi:hypothetical protein
MQATMSKPNLRGVYCRHCGSPIPLSNSILKRESLIYQSEQGPTEQWCSKVFPHRCRTCGAESIYALNHIVDFEHQSPM